MFRRALNPSLAMKILTDTTKNNTLKNDVIVTAAVAANGTTRAAAIPATTTINKYGWYAKAIQYNQIYREALRCPMRRLQWKLQRPRLTTISPERERALLVQHHSYPHPLPRPKHNGC